MVKKLRDELPKRLQNKILKKAVNDGCKLIRKTARQKVAVGETGLLKKSIGTKIVVKRSTGRVIGIVGPRTGYKSKKVKGQRKKVRTITKLGEEFKAAGVDPVRYAHLVEKGTKHSAAKAFLRPALDNNLGAVKEIFARTIKDGLEQNRIGSVPNEGMQPD